MARTLDIGDGVEPVEALRHALTGRSDLIVLDNCEHLVEAAAALVEGLSSYCPSIRFLTTSRTRLGVAGEAVWAVPPLTTPDADELDQLADLDLHAATRLFLDRAAAAGVTIDDAPDRARTIAAICAAVDGLPLGIELAAALSRELPLTRVAAGLASSRAPAGGDRVAGRHRSLDAAIGWGYDVLHPVAQLLVRRLAVFEGGWTIDAVEAVCGGDGVEDVPEVLAGLVAASFVTFAPSNDRYAMLETVRVFARARLAASGEIERRRDAHLTWCRTLVDGCRSGLASESPRAVVQRLEREQPNLRAALRWAIDDDRHLTDAEQLALGLNVFWWVTGGSREAVGWMRRILDRPGPVTADRVALTMDLSDQLQAVGDIAAAATACDAALDLARTLGDRRVECRCLATAAFFSVTDEKVGLAVEAEALATSIGDADLMAAAIHMQGLLAARTGRYAVAAAHYRKALATGTDPSHMLGTRFMLGVVLSFHGRWDEAREELLAAEMGEGTSGAPTDAMQTCAVLTEVELACGDPVAAEAGVRAGRRLGSADGGRPRRASGVRRDRRAPRRRDRRPRAAPWPSLTGLRPYR